MKRHKGMTHCFAHITKVLEPLYGPQESALAKIGASPSDRVAYILFQEEV